VQQKVEYMEKDIGALFQTIPNNTGPEGVSPEDKMKKSSQELEKYKSQIKELEECAVPTTPLEVRVQ
jgi:peptidoglycan hydrolase CwlO-like protein